MEKSKYCNSKSVHDLKDTETVKNEICEESENVEIVPLPKKRGRKPKQKQNVDLTHDISDQDEGKLSRSGRKRRSVNYYALENPDIIETKIKKIDDESADRELCKRKLVKGPRKRSSIISKETEKENVKTDSVVLEKTLTMSNETSINENIAEVTKTETLDESNEIEIQVKKEKHYRKTGNTTQLVNTLLSQVGLNKTISDPVEVPKRGRRKVKKYNTPQKDKIGHCRFCQPKKFHRSINFRDATFANQKTVTCAVCKKELENNNWSHHKQRYHNNLAWRLGDTPLDLSDSDFVKYTLNSLYASRKPFHCDICDKAVKSVNGFLSHKSICGKDTLEDVKVACDICGRKMLPVSLPAHIRSTHEVRDKVEIIAKKKLKMESTGKRHAAEKALKVIKNFNLETSQINTTFSKYFEDLSFLSSEEASSILKYQCDTSKQLTCKYPECNFNCFSDKDIANHLKFCIKKPEMGYVCKYCLLVKPNIAEMIYHIESVHEIIIQVDETEVKADATEKTPRKRNSSQKNFMGEKDKQLKKGPTYILPTDRVADVVFCKAYEWTLKFCETHYSSVLPEEFFPCWKLDWQYMDLDKAVDYLPKMPYSCDVGFETVSCFQDVLHKDHTFRKFEMFEAYLENNGNSTIFCGGPVTALAWMPTPYETGGLHQIVAVATKSDPDVNYEISVNYNEKCFIQFWDVGPLKNTDTSLFRPKQASCLQFDHGPVWDLQWCPSGCYDTVSQPDNSDLLTQMGVLAVAGSDSYVYIYSIPQFKDSCQFYNAKPAMVLIRNLSENEKLGNMDYYATRISWSKAQGHRYLAVGYSNGQVAMYDLCTDSFLSRHKSENNITVLMPYMVLDAHYHSITAIALHHSNGGSKWLMTGSWDRTVRTWDLDQRTCVRTLKGNVVNDGVWMTHWLCHIVGYDEASTIGNASTAIHQCQDGQSDPLYLFHCASSVTSITTSDWLNGIIQANSVGEIFATFPKQLLNITLKNMKNKKLLLGYTTLVEKDKTVEERLKVNTEKQKALKNQLKIKTKISAGDLPAGREVNHLDYNPHYFEYEPLAYDEMDEKYGLIFCDHKMKKWSDFPSTLQEQMSHSSDKYAPSRPNMYPLQKITKIQFNMNRQASCYYVTGYQAGFIRLTYMKFLDQDPQILRDSVKLEE